MSRKDQAGKAALLTELLGEDRLADWQRTGVLPRKTSKKSDPESVAWHRNRLIEKFRERGLLPPTDAKPVSLQDNTKVAPEPLSRATSSEFTPGGLGARLAKHLNPDRLADEHPAVIALFLRSQTAQLRSQVLRGLPGGQARAVMRILRAKSAAVRPKPEVPTAEAPSTRVEEPEPKPEEPVELPRKQVRTRRAL